MELPVPPLAIGKTPVTPGVILAEPSKFTALVLAKLVRIERAVASLVAVAAFPVVFKSNEVQAVGTPLVK